MPRGSNVRRLPRLVRNQCSPDTLSATSVAARPLHYLTYQQDCHFDVSPLPGDGMAAPLFQTRKCLRESYDCIVRMASIAVCAAPHRSPLKQGSAHTS